jgi:hypothetical protein
MYDVPLGAFVAGNPPGSKDILDGKSIIPNSGVLARRRFNVRAHDRAGH